MRSIIAVAVAVVVAGCSVDVPVDEPVECREMALMGHRPRGIPVGVSADTYTIDAVSAVVDAYSDTGDEVLTLGGDSVVAIAVGETGEVDFVSFKIVTDGFLDSATITASSDAVADENLVFDALVQILGRVALGIDGITAEPQCIDRGVEVFLEANAP